MAKIDNVDIDQIKAFGEQLKIDPTKARKTQVGTHGEKTVL